MKSLITKILTVNNERATLSYYEDIIGKDANTSRYSIGYTGVSIETESGKTYELYVNGGEYFNDETGETEEDYYFEVDGTERLSDCIYEEIESEEDLINTLLYDEPWSYSN